eukprot:9468586-Pyramimonas_sp.AAC.2
MTLGSSSSILDSLKQPRGLFVPASSSNPLVSMLAAFPPFGVSLVAGSGRCLASSSSRIACSAVLSPAGATSRCPCGTFPLLALAVSLCLASGCVREGVVAHIFSNACGSSRDFALSCSSSRESSPTVFWMPPVSMQHMPAGASGVQQTAVCLLTVGRRFTRYILRTDPIAFSLHSAGRRRVPCQWKRWERDAHVRQFALVLGAERYRRRRCPTPASLSHCTVTHTEVVLSLLTYT